MGTQFFWFYDLVILAVFIAVVLKCARKGFVSSIAGFLSAFVAFAVALPVSDTCAVLVYDNIVEDSLSTEINEQLSSAIDGTSISLLDGLDLSKIKVNDHYISEISTQIDSAGRITIDMSDTDYSETGIENVDLSFFGITSETVDYSAMNLGTIQISQNELDEYGLEKMVLINTLSNRMSNGTAFGAVCGVAESMTNAIPQLLSGFSDSVSSGEQSAIKSLVIGIVNVESNDYASSILDNVVKPSLLLPIRALIFIILFAIIMLLLGIIVNALKVINKIPVIGSVNVFFGVIVGVCESLIVCFLICIGLQIIISLSGNELIFINTPTINNTIVFKYIYNFEFLDFIP